MRRALSVVFTLFFTFLLFSPSLGYDFVYDDYQLIVTNPRLTSWSYLPGYFTTHFWSQSQLWAPKFYRPLFLVWLRLMYEMFGLATRMWHFASILLHLVTVIVVFVFIRYLVKDFWAALLAAAVFAIHPVQTETVVWASSGSDMLAGLFLVLSVLFYAQRKGQISPLSILFATLAIFSKDNGIVVLPLIFVYEWTRSRLKDAVVNTAPYAVPAIVYLACRMHALGTLSSKARPSMGVGVMVMNWPQTLGDYAKHILWPVRLSTCYDFPRERAYWPLLVMIVILGGIVWGLRKASPTMRFGAAWFAITMLPTLALRYMVVGDFVHDRYLYVPMIGLAIILGEGLSTVTFKVPAAIATCLIAGLLAFSTSRNLPIWQDDMSLFTRAYEVAPHNTLAITYLIDADMRANRLEEANRLFEQLNTNRQSGPGMRPNAGGSH